MNTIETVQSYIVRKFLHGEAQGLTPTTPLFEQGIIDSMGILDLVQFLEKTFSITVEDREYLPDYFATLERIRVFVQSKQGQQLLR